MSDFREPTSEGDENEIQTMAEATPDSIDYDHLRQVIQEIISGGHNGHVSIDFKDHGGAKSFAPDTTPEEVEELMTRIKDGVAKGATNIKIVKFPDSLRKLFKFR